MKLLFPIFGVLTLLFNLERVNGGPPLQLEKEEPLFPDTASHSPRYIMPDYRLPKQFIPINYKLKLRPILDPGDDQFSVPGTVTILATCTNATNSLVLHVNGVDINHNSVKVTDAVTNETLPRLGFATNITNQIYVTLFNTYLVQDRNYTIYIEFTARAGDINQVLGMYYRSYETNGVTKNLIITKLEAVGARMIFPSFDEPDLKATFDVSIGHTLEYNTLCNMPKVVENETDATLPGWVWDHYETSVQMSTYLLAIIVSDFTSVDAAPGLYPKPVRTWGTREQISAGAGVYSANDTALMMTYFENLYDQEYPLPKMDSIALPGFSSGAMEQWGLITYRIDYLMYFEGETTESQRRRVSQVIAHELAHQWFGNIVTMKWWDDLWLNEGFANYVEKFGLHEFHPDFESDNLIVADDLQASMNRDALPNSLPVNYDGDNLSAIVYNKAAFLIRMMAAFLTENTFQRAINEYLQVYKWGNAVQDGLFEILTVHGHKDGTLRSDLTVKDIMNTWTKQTGFPLIRVSRVTDTLVYISQERFGNAIPLINTTVLDPNHLWHVPITYYTNSDTNYGTTNQLPKLWLEKDNVLVTRRINASIEWIVFNTDARGYYRVLYDTRLFTPILVQLADNHTVFSDATRSQLLDDQFKSAFLGYATIADGMELTKYLHKESKLVVWSTFFNNFRTPFTHLTSNSKYATVFKNYFSTKIEGALTLIDLEQGLEERGARVILRSQLLDWACSLKTLSCTEYADKLFAQWNTPSDAVLVPVDIRPVMFCAIVGQLSTEELREQSFNFMVNKFSTETVLTTKTQYRNALSCVTDPSIITRLLNGIAIPPVMIGDKSDGIELFRRLMGNSDARNAALDYLATNWAAVVQYFGIVNVANIISGLRQHVNERTKLQEVETFLEDRNEPLLWTISTINETLSAIRSNIEWMETFGEDMGIWLSDV